MKKLSYVAVAIALVFSSAAFAVQYDPACATAGMLDEEGGSISYLLAELDFFGKDVYVPWAEMDADDNGILDQWEFAMLAAVICAAPSGAVAGQFEANSGGFGNVVIALQNVADFLGEPAAGHDPLAEQCEDVGNLILAWLDRSADLGAPYGVQSPRTLLTMGGQGTLVTQIETLGNALATGGNALSEVLGEFAEKLGMYVPLIGATKEGWAAMAGMSTDFKNIVLDLFGDLLGDIATAQAGLPTVAGGLTQVVGAQSLLPAPLQMTSGEQAMLAMLAGDLNALIPLLTPASTLPGIEIYGVTGKAAGEPFSAEGDYNGDGLTNKETYDATVGAGGDMAGYVSNATGDDPFWAGNPNLPAVGLLGLAALIGSLALGGIARRK